MNKHLIQPLITTNPNKYHLVPESKPFFSSTHKKLDHMIEISKWMQNCWCEDNENHCDQANNLKIFEHASQT